jgi:hypothetical protein
MTRPSSGVPLFKLDSLAVLSPFPESETTTLDGAPLQAHEERDFILPPSTIGFVGEEHVITAGDEPEINLTKLDRMKSLYEPHPEFIDMGILDHTTLSSAELNDILTSLHTCLRIRDKYMAVSLQRLGDNPRDHDGAFKGFSDDLGGVSGIRPDAYAKLQSKETGETRNPKLKEDQRQFEPWKIYPKPPPPHWHWKAKNPQPNSPPLSSSTGIPMLVSDEGEGDGFEFDQCEIPGKHEWVYRLDSKGVFQVYRADPEEGEGMSPQFICCRVLSS